MVGSGASAVQRLVPHLVRDGERVVLFQRTPNYLLPKLDQPYKKWHAAMFHRLPVTQRAERGGIWGILEQFARGLDAASPVGKVNRAIAMRHLHSQIKDPQLRAKLTPDYPIGCKRILFSNEFYPALAEPTVEVVTEGVTEVRPHGVIDESGREHPADVIVYATGFDSQDFLDQIDVTGIDGEKLATKWADGAHAYLGMYVPGFPNLFRDLRPQHQPRRRLDHLHARGPGPAHAPGRRPARGRPLRQRPGDGRDRAGVRPRPAGEARPLGVGQLRELVPAPVGPHHVELAGRDPAVRTPHPLARADRVRLGMTYPAEPWDLHGHAYVGIWLMRGTDDREVPPGVRAVRVLGFRVVGAAFFVYEEPSPLTYHELMATQVVRDGLRPRVNITDIWVDSPDSRDGGRELWAIPKELAEFEVTADSTYVASGIGSMRVGRRRRLPGRWPLGFRIANSAMDPRSLPGARHRAGSLSSRPAGPSRPTGASPSCPGTSRS